MKVAYIVGCFPSRTETFALREMSALRKRGLRIFILAAARAKDEMDIAGADGFPVTYRPARFSLTALSSILYLLRHYPSAPVKFLALLISVVQESPREALTLLANIHTVGSFARLLDTHSVGHVHAYFLSWPGCIGLALSRLTGRRLSLACHARDVFVEAGAVRTKADASCFIVACNRQAHEHLAGLLTHKSDARLCLIRHGVDPSELASRRPHGTRDDLRRHEPPTIAAVGRLVPKKGYGYLLGALRLLKLEGIVCRLVVVGDGPQRRELEKLAALHGLEGSVEMAGWQDPAETIRMIRSAAVLAVPSVAGPDGDRDGIPNVILEAFAVGTPVLAARQPGIMEAVRHLETGILVDPRNEKEMAAGLRRLLRDANLRTTVRQNARTLVRGDFDLASNAAKLATRFIAFDECPTRA